MDEAMHAVILQQEKIDHIYHLFLNMLNSTMEQAETASYTPVVVKLFDWDGSLFTCNRQPIRPRDEGAPIKALLRERKLDFLLPAETADPVTAAIDPALLASARAGNMTSRSKLVRALGLNERRLSAADEAKLAEVLGDTDSADTVDTTSVDAAARAAAAAAAAANPNPFVGLRNPMTGKVDPAKQAEVAMRIKRDGIAAVVALSKAAGVTLSGLPLRKAG